MHCRFIASIDDIEAKLWDSLNSNNDPFLSHRFLSLLESSKSVAIESGWQPQHLLVEKGDVLIAAMPLYLKYHSYGEYVFDWSWADAYHRHGLEYYPKLVSAIPFTPASGTRLLAKEVSVELLLLVKNTLKEKCRHDNLSGWHILFPDNEELEQLKPLEGLQRTACHFQWFNHDFNHFDDFLARFSSRKRKNLRKERQKVFDQGIHLQRLTGSDIEERHWQCLEHCYRVTYAKRSGHGGYLTESFFTGLRALADKILLVVAYKQQQPIACALNFFSNDTLFGRYWGAFEDIDGLHFEACYYQGIEFCIEQGLSRFDPGVQGEHKLARGFEPVITQSLHYVCDLRFSEAIEHFLSQEQKAIDEYQMEMNKRLPFRQEGSHE